MAYWSWVLADKNGNGLLDLSDSYGRSFGKTRNRTSEAVFALSLKDEAAHAMSDQLKNHGVPQLRIYHSAEPFTVSKPGQLVFSGYWMDHRGHANPRGSSVEVAFRDPFARLEYRYTDLLVRYDQVDAGGIAWAMIDAANLDGDTGIDQGVIAATKTRDRTYESKQLAEGIVQLTEVIDGFDFNLSPLDASLTRGKLAAFNVYQNQGEVQDDVRFEYGEGTLDNIRDFSFTTPRPVTKSLVLGENGLSSVRSSETSKYGIWQVSESAVDVNQQSTLDDKAVDLLRPSVDPVFYINADAKIAPRPIQDFDIGDTVRVGIDYGSISEDMTLRVSSWYFTFTEDGIEDEILLGFDGAEQ